MAKAFYETEWFRRAGTLPPADRLKFWDAVSAWAEDEPVPDPKGPSRLLILHALSLLQADRNHRMAVSRKRSEAGRMGAQVWNGMRSSRAAAEAGGAPGPANAEAQAANAGTANAAGQTANAMTANAAPDRGPENPVSVEYQREEAFPSARPNTAYAAWANAAPAGADAEAANAAFAPAPPNNNITKSIPYPLKVLPEGNADSSPVCLQTRMEEVPAPETEDARARELPVIGIPLNDGGKYGVTREEVEQYEQLYPAVDVMQELRNMVGWCDADPRRRKTRGGAKRFVNGWLMKAQNRGGQGLPSRQAPFNPYRQFVKGDVFNDL